MGGITVSEKLKKAKDKLNQAGHAVDDFVEDTSDQHNYPKWKVWLGLGIAAMALFGAGKLIGWI